PEKFFNNFTDIDRQTELNDDDGSLTGLTNDANPPTGTISVNPTEFFKAPVETAECLSNVGVIPDKACPAAKTPTPATATTSPYDYVTTVIYPECAVGEQDPPPGVPPLGRCGSFKDTSVVQGNRYERYVKRGGIWSEDCANPACYGVPLYRQFLTGEEQKLWDKDNCKDKKASDDCRWPLVRMGGQSTYQRSTLTINHGKYFLDTTVSAEKQGRKEPLGEDFTSVNPCVDVAVPNPSRQPSVNVFEAGKTYYMFFPFAKKETKQIYQIYVGDGFNPETDLKAHRPWLELFPIRSMRGESNWPKGWLKKYTPGSPILEVTIDFA